LTCPERAERVEGACPERAERVEGVSVVIATDARARALVRTADSLLRQTQAADRIVIAAAESTSRPILQSLEQRIGAVAVCAKEMSDAINASVRSCDCDAVLLVPAGYRLHERAIELSVAALDANPGAVAAAPRVREESADGTRGIVRSRPAFGPVDLFVDAMSVPPVLCVRRTEWDRAGGLDETYGPLAMCELLLRLQTAGISLGLDEVLAFCDIADGRGWAQLWPTDVGYLRGLESLVEKHRAIVEPLMQDVLIAREIGFGSMRDAHRDLVRRAGADLQKLEALRSDAAHARAYLAHHGQQGLDWGDLRRTVPISRDWGYDRGVPVDRYYIDDFIALRSSDIRGSVLEVQESDLTVKFGGPRVGSSSIVDLDESNPRATHLADLRCAPHIPADSFDCIILTQTLHVIDDAGAVLKECRRMLKPDGVLLATLPSASRACLEYGESGDLWRVTPAGARTLFDDTFGSAAVDVRTYGNVLTNVAFLEGLASAELTDQEFETVDPYFPALVGVRAQKRPVARASRDTRRFVLLYHRVDDEADVHGLAVPMARFQEQLKRLASDYAVLPLEELLTTSAADLPPHAVAITFDDGYLDNLERAAPALERAGLPATFFLTSRWLDTPGEYWWDLLERALLANDSLPRSIEVNAAGDRLQLDTATAEARLATHARLHALMVQARLDVRDAVADQLIRLTEALPRRRPLVADEVRALARVPGVCIGAHTVNHLSLPAQPADVVVKEIHDCRAAIKRVTGVPVDLFAYPYGAVTRTCADPVRAGFRWACSCEEAAIGRSFDAARVGRVEVRNWTADQLSETLDRVFAASAR
jgi:peptidoglycan/xylan/chitin deacetylase (PgdA/CDA1 family)